MTMNPNRILYQINGIDLIFWTIDAVVLNEDNDHAW